jgi:hypothetical protein
VNKEKYANNILQYFKVLTFGFLLVFSPCSVRNSIQESLNLEKTGVTNKSKTTNNFEELCSTLIVDATGDHPNKIINTTPGIPAFGIAQTQNSQIKWINDENLSSSHYQAPSTVKDKTPLYLLHQQFKTYLLAA